MRLISTFDKKVFVAMAVATLLGVLARFSHLGTKSLWLDEAISLEIARLDWQSLFAVLTRHEANMSFYYFLLHFWIRLGQSEFAIRSLSAVFGALTIPAIYFLGTFLGGKRAGVIAAFLVALNPAHIAYSQEARAYSLAILLAVVSSLLLLRAMWSNSRAVWLAYAATNVCGVYSHVFFAWLVVVHAIVLLISYRALISWRRAMESYVAFLVFLLPLAYIAMASHGSQLSWIQPTKGEDLLRFFVDSGGFGGGALALLYVSLAVIAVVGGNNESSPEESRHRIFLVAWWLVPVVGTFLISLKSPIFVPRYLSICWPAMVILAAIGISNLRIELFRWLAILCMIAFSGYGTHLYLRAVGDSSQTNDWRGAAKYLSQVADRGDAVLFYYGAERFPFDYYMSQYRSTVDTYPAASNVELLSGKVSEPDNEFLRGLSRRYKRIHVLSEFRPNALSQRVSAALSVPCSRQGGSKDFGFVHVEIFDYSQSNEGLPCRNQSRGSK